MFMTCCTCCYDWSGGMRFYAWPCTMARKTGGGGEKSVPPVEAVPESTMRICSCDSWSTVNFLGLICRKDGVFLVV